MKVALVAPPFISVPPDEYGGTELFIGHLATGLKRLDVEVIVYTNGDSTVEVEKRWLFEKAQWPIKHDGIAQLKDVDHTTWAVRDAADGCDLIHLHSAPGIACSRFSTLPFVYTLHHPTEPHLSEFYARFPDVHYVCISEDQRSRERLPKVHTIHHGVDLSQYQLQTTKQPYLSFIGRIAPIKGTHLAIEIAKQSGIPLKIAGEIQPQFKDYFEAKVKPHIDGSFIQYVGRADLAAKNELLGNSMAMLFPITWHEPFGLVMIEAMACGTPVLALKGGSVPEVVSDGVSGFVARSTGKLVVHLRDLRFDPVVVREYVEQNFSLKRMARDYCSLYAEILNNPRASTAGEVLQQSQGGVTTTAGATDVAAQNFRRSLQCHTGDL